MNNEIPYETTALQLSPKDLMLIAEVQTKVEPLIAHFKFRDISRATLALIASETTMRAMQVIAGHQFLDLKSRHYYKFAYMKIHVNNLRGEVEIKPVFRRCDE